MDSNHIPILFSLLSLSFLLLISTTTSIIAESIQGCGGFVEASSSLIKTRKQSGGVKLDYSHITVELQTLDELVKESTQCAPNGYYFIPVYDKGSFIIKVKGPEGWSWDPDKAPVVIGHDGCNANADVNFRFTGFKISGRIKGAVGGESCLSKDGGPQGVEVELLSQEDNANNLISSVFTSSDGSYSFPNIIPGKYKLRASHSNLKVEVRGSPEVELGFENGLVDDIFFIPGYNVEGHVVAQGIPILGVHIYLYSEDVPEVNCVQGFGNSPWMNSALCHAISDAKGHFKFDSIPCGTYELLPYYKGENTIFDVSPSSISFSVEHHHVTVLQKFEVTGFSVGGRVVNEKGEGVDGVNIIVDGHKRSFTDSQGYYKLDQVTSKPYKIVAEKAHYKFNSLIDYLVLPNMTLVVDIKAAYYDICGIVNIFSAGYKAKVTLTNGPVLSRAKLVDDTGKFCFDEVSPGEYSLSALAATGDKTPELLFTPTYLDVVVDRPLLDIEFSQVHVNIRGTILCKVKCGPFVTVELTPLKSKCVEKRMFSLSEDSSFIFPEVLPGKYSLEVKHKPLPDTTQEDTWCWEKNTIGVDVGTDDLEGIIFVQKGYWITIHSSHDSDAYVRQLDESIINFQIKKGTQRICFEHSGIHELQFLNSCIFFGSLAVKFDTLNPLPIYLKGEKYLLIGQVHVKQSLHQSIHASPESIIVDIVASDGTVFDSKPTRIVSGEDHISGDTIYEYSFWANLGDELTFVPRDVRKGDEKNILFYPRQQQVSVTVNGCQTTIPSFAGRLGLYIEGSVSPPLSGVNIKVVAATESKNALLREGELALETTTGLDGFFIGGPLYDDTDYKIDASKAGYHLKPLGPTTFSCQKLSQITVQINSGEKTMEPFPSVFLSLSGEDGYRNNTVTGVGGYFLFDSLFPGSFYLRPLLKEYSFSPPAQAIELASGQAKEVIFQATRVAYSAKGTVSLLSGLPLEGISIEARSESKGYYEEARTDSSGSYRLRGLLPNTNYLIKVVEKGISGSARIERASPEVVSVRVGTEDIKDMDFVVFEQPERTIISGHVEGEKLDTLQSHLLVEVKLAADPSKIESVFPLPLSHFFQIHDLPKAKHLVQLHYSFPSSTHTFESEPIEVDLEQQAQIHIGQLKYKVEENHHKQELTPAPVFPLIVGVGVIALFISMPRLKDLYQLGIASSGSISTIKKEARKSSIRKKTY